MNIITFNAVKLSRYACTLCMLQASSACCKHPLVMWSPLNDCNTRLYLQGFHWYLPVFDSKYSGILCVADV